MEERLNAITDALKKKFGEEHQDLVLVEEMSELTKEIVKFNNRACRNMRAIEEECADVLIAIYQLMRNHGIEDGVEKIVESKLGRIENRYLTEYEDADGIIKELDDICKDFFESTDEMFRGYKK